MKAKLTRPVRGECFCLAKMYRTIRVAILFVTPVLAGPRPGAAPGFPQLTPAQYQEMMSEVDNYLSKMSEEEINTMVQEAMKDPGFQKFVEEVESGKIKPEELFGVQPGAAPAPAAGPAAVPAPAPVVAPVAKPVEKPALTPQRSKSSAAEMLKALLATIGNLRMKAASYHKVGDMLKPFNRSLDAFVYYLSALVDAKKTDHIEQLIGDRNFLPLHDALKRLSDELRVWEPRVETPEFGERDMVREVKEQSKVALQKVLSLFQHAFDMQQLISGLEQLFAKYEPEILRRRKVVEENEQRAIKEAEQAKQIRPSTARIEREGRYVRPAPTFYDWFYEQPEGPRYYDRAPDYEYDRDRGRTGDLKPMSGGESRKGLVPAEEKKKEKEAEAAKPGKATKSSKVPQTVEPGLAEIEQAAKQIATMLADNYEGAFVPNLGAIASSYLAAPAPRMRHPQQRGQPALNVPDIFNKVMGELTNALNVIQRYRGDVNYEISKMDSGAAKQQAQKRLAAAIDQNSAVLRPIYDTSVKFMNNQQINRGGNPLINYPQLQAHYAGTVMHNFHEAMELVYGINKAEREQGEAAVQQMLGGAPAAAQGAQRGQRPAAQRPHQAPRRHHHRQAQPRQPLLALPAPRPPINVDEPD
jgi:hypothetical protein